jgi:hypothetical protein
MLPFRLVRYPSRDVVRLFACLRIVSSSCLSAVMLSCVRRARRGSGGSFSLTRPWQGTASNSVVFDNRKVAFPFAATVEGLD